MAGFVKLKGTSKGWLMRFVRYLHKISTKCFEDMSKLSETRVIA